MHANTIIKKVFIFGASVLIGIWTLTGVAAAAPAPRADGGAGAAASPHDGQSSHVKECSPSHHSDSGHGANTDGATNPYHNTCEGEHAPGNGVGDGAARGKPCAGCVGNADDKNPPGQAPGGSDHNAGYECDRNQGVGKENPAHTGCASGETGEGSNGGGGSQGPVCPAGASAMTDHEFELDGASGELDDVAPGDTVEVTFTIAAGCSDIEVSLASYGADRKLSDSDSGTFGAGEHTLVVDTPDCATEVDFVFGGVVPQLNAAEGSPYSDQGRLIDAGSGTSSCPASVGGSNQTNTNSNNSSSNTSNTSSNTTTNGVSSSDVLAPAVSGTAGNGAVDASVVPADVLGIGTPGGGSSLGSAVTRGRPAEVLGVSYERSAPSLLARTGAEVDVVALALVGGLLSIAGIGLSSVRSRRDTVSVAARIAGYGVAA